MSLPDRPSLLGYGVALLLGGGLGFVVALQSASDNIFTAIGVAFYSSGLVFVGALAVVLGLLPEALPTPRRPSSAGQEPSDRGLAWQTRNLGDRNQA